MPRAFAPFETAVQKGIEGLRLYRTDVGLLHITEAILAGKLTATRQSHDAYQAAIAAHPRAIAPLRDIDEQVGKFIALTRDVLKMKLGSRYSKQWIELGFVTPTLRVPRRRLDRLSRLKSLEWYFLTYPEAEVAALGLTAPRAAELHDSMLAAMMAVEAARVEQRQRKADRDAAMDDLRQAMIRLYRELKVLLPANDPRWMEFGFNVPADLTVPAAPEAVEATPGGAKNVTVKCDRPVGATRFRIFQKVEGKDADFVHVHTVHELKTTLGGYESGTRVEFYMTAANAAGESPPSAIVGCMVV